MFTTLTITSRHQGRLYSDEEMRRMCGLDAPQFEEATSDATRAKTHWLRVLSTLLSHPLRLIAR